MTRKRALVGAVAAALLFGCQLLVGSDLPEFACASDAPSACPSGRVCDVSIGRCVDPSSIGVDATDEGQVDAPPPVEAGSDVDAASGPLGLGEKCRVDAECQSRICGTSTILTTAVVQTSGPICTRTCCTSSDCPSGFICYGGATGGNYCVPAAQASRQPPSTGGLGPGVPCTANGQCRSGLCQTRCVDTCCRAGDCVSGTTCRVKTVAAHDIWVCAAPEAGATKGPTEACTTNSQCQSDVCITGGNGQCRPVCCGRADCVGFNNGHCRYGDTGVAGETFKFCLFSTQTSRKGLGETCVADSDCQTDFCDPERKICADVCCVDADCAAIGAGYTCRPSVPTPFLRCVR